MKNLKCWSLAALLLLLTLAPALAEQMKGTGVSLDAPSGWTQAAPQKGAALVLFAPNPLPNFKPNINVRIEETGGMTLKEYTDLNIAQLKKAGAGNNPVVNFKFKNGLVGKKTVFSLNLQGNDLSFFSAWVVSSGKTYLFTGTAPKASFGKYEFDFDKIARTMKPE